MGLSPSGWFAAVPIEDDGAFLLAGDVLADELFEQLVADPARRLFVMVIAVGAVEIAPRADGLGDNVEGARMFRLRCRWLSSHLVWG
jgi:hypothetical protein